MTALVCSLVVALVKTISTKLVTLSCSCSTMKTKLSLQQGFRFPIFTEVFFFFPILFPFLSSSLIFTQGSKRKKIQIQDQTQIRRLLVPQGKPERQDKPCSKRRDKRQNTDENFSILDQQLFGAFKVDRPTNQCLDGFQLIKPPKQKSVDLINGW